MEQQGLHQYEALFPGLRLSILTKEVAEQHAAELAALADQIPAVTYEEENILAESKDNGKRVFHGKWDHSLVLFDGTKPIALIIGYERESEENNQYPDNTIYISELAVDEDHQRKGIAKNLLSTFLDLNKRIGLIHLPGKTNFSIQTNSADWNQHVQNLYKGFGFTQRATKQYPDRTDVVLGWKPQAPRV